MNDGFETFAEASVRSIGARKYEYLHGICRASSLGTRKAAPQN